MADLIRPSELTTERTTPVASEYMVVDNGDTVAKSKISDVVNSGRPLASQAEAEAGTQATKAMTPLTTKQAINAQGDVRFATAAQGALADTAVQPGDLATVAATGNYNDLIDKPTISDETAAQSRAWAIANLHPVSAPAFIRTAGYASAGDFGGALYSNVASEPAHAGKFSITLADAVTVVWYELAEALPNILMFGADTTGVADSQPAFDAANTYGKPCFVPEGDWRLDTGGPLSSGTKFYGVSGKSNILQYGQQAFIGDEDLENVVISGLSFDFQGTAGTYTTALSLKAHAKCVFENLYFVRYTDATIIERLPQNATINTIDNIYRNWMIETCLHVAITIGQDGWATSFQGDGATTIINTGLAWPEQFNSSVIVFMETATRGFNQLTLATDYTVSYDGSGVLTVTLASAATVNQRIHIFPSQPRTDFATGRERRPVSNNRWDDIKTRFGIGHHGFIDVRWVDYEIYTNVRLFLNAGGVRGFLTNPGVERTCEAGDFNQYHACLVSYLTGADATTIVGWHFGPGSLQMAGYGVAADLNWIHSGANRTILVNDKETVALTGTVTVDVGTPTIVTGTGTVFRDELTLIGDSVDTIMIGTEIRGIASIDSDTQLTLTAAATAVSGVPASRRNSKNGVSYDFHYAAMGGSASPASSNVRRGVGRAYAKSSTDFSAVAEILAGTLSIAVPHTLWRAPNVLKDKISLTPTENISAGGVKNYWVTGFTASQVTVAINAAAASDLSFVVSIELGPLN